MSRIFKTTGVIDTEYLLSQTPPNFVEANYYLKEMQDKVDADWRFRPNRKWVEEEREPGTEAYTPLEVIVQSVQGDKGEKVSDDWYRLVFRDCRRKNRLGKRYRFSYVFDPYEENEDKNIWIGLNQTSLSPTSAQVVRRCNGSIGSIWTDESGVNHIHYEPVIQPTKLDSANFQFSEVAIDPRSQMVLVAQHNKYTEQYYINQRFVIGYDRIYKITNVSKSDSLTTFDAHDVGIMRIYLEQDQIGKLDDMERRIAYNGIKEDPVPLPDEDGNYSLQIVEPKNIPEFLGESGLIFKPQVLLGVNPQSAEIYVSCELTGAYAEDASIGDYCELIALGDGRYNIYRKKENLGLGVRVTCRAEPGKEELKLSFELQLRDF